MISLTFTEPIQSDVLVGYYMEYTVNQDEQSPEFFVVSSEIKINDKPLLAGGPDSITVTKNALARMLREIRGDGRATG